MAGTRYAPPRSLRRGGDLEALRVSLQTNERYMRRWANRLGAWRDWIPGWDADSSSPVIGDGTIEGKYVEYGNLVTAHFTIRPGATTTFGSGEYLIDTPIPAQPFPDEVPVGTLTLSGASRHHWFLISAPEGIRASAPGAESPWNNAAPFTMADGDAYIGQMTYEAL